MNKWVSPRISPETFRIVRRDLNRFFKCICDTVLKILIERTFRTFLTVLIFLFKQVEIDIYVIYNVVGLLYSYYSERDNSRFLVPLIEVSNSKSKHRTVNIRSHRTRRGRRFDLDYHSKFQQDMMGRCPKNLNIKSRK